MQSAHKPRLPIAALGFEVLPRIGSICLLVPKMRSTSGTDRNGPTGRTAAEVVAESARRVARRAQTAWSEKERASCMVVCKECVDGSWVRRGRVPARAGNVGARGAPLYALMLFSANRAGMACIGSDASELRAPAVPGPAVMTDADCPPSRHVRHNYVCVLHASMTDRAAGGPHSGLRPQPLLCAGAIGNGARRRAFVRRLRGGQRAFQAHSRCEHVRLGVPVPAGVTKEAIPARRGRRLPAMRRRAEE